MKHNVMLIIRDGYGKLEKCEDNAVCLAKTPFTDFLMEKYPKTTLQTCSQSVGLPKNTMGGSEVGHMTIGAGRVIWQQLERINRTIEDETFFELEAFVSKVRYAKENGKSVHILGLLQDKGVHAHINHLFALLEICRREKMRKDRVWVHVFSDGRDSPPKSAQEYIKILQEKLDEMGIGIIGSICGRFYAMDRDTRWNRTQLAYELLMSGVGHEFKDADECLHYFYSKDVTDEFIEPSVVSEFTGIYEGDVIFCYNYRTDRVRQLFRALCDVTFDEFPVSSKKFTSLNVSVMTSYYDGINASIGFDNPCEKNLLGEVISNNNLTQLRISETEKYPHVTFFFNAQRDEPYINESRVLIPSPREVTTYDEKPEMSCYEIKDVLLKELEKEYDMVVVNLVNGDMVGHCGKLEPAIRAVETVDTCLKEIIEKGLEKGYECIVFADHGNCEEMSGEHQTSHTLNDVDCILVSNKEELQKDKITLHYGGLYDIAPTVLELLNIDIPKEMTGRSLITRK